MNTGLGLSEILLIFTLILVFFGSKELPQFIRSIAKFMARIRYYTEKVRNELDTITADTPQINENTVSPKKQLRQQFLTACKALPPDVRQEKSKTIFEYLINSSFYRNASTIMIYVNFGNEVETKDAINHMLLDNKRIVVPFCKNSAGELGIAEIHDLEKDICIGELGAPEVKTECRKPFFKSDLHLIICPGVAFDKFGGRLGRGKSCYDRFLKEIKGQIPIIGFAFDCQINQNQLPFDYHDIPMDQIITESGLLLNIEMQPAINLQPTDSVSQVTS